MNFYYEFSYFRIPIDEGYFKINKVKAKVRYSEIIFGKEDAVSEKNIDLIISRDILRNLFLLKKRPIYALILLDSSIKTMSVSLTNLLSGHKRILLYSSERFTLVGIRENDRVDIEIPNSLGGKEIRFFNYNDFVDYN